MLTKKMPMLCTLAALLATTYTPVQAAAEAAPANASTQTLERKVDALFAKWNRPDSPGAAIEVIREGKVLLRKGYGMADIERGLLIQPTTVFQVASMSKQFTAFAIHLLAAEGKLKLDDDIRTHLPELQDFGQKITIRNMLQHTSGLRDAIALLWLSGRRADDVMTDGDMFNMIKQQRTLNFKPGQEAAYSNSNYLLLGRVVERLSGQSFSAFAEQRIFSPLGMRNTHIREQYGDLVPGRALSYVPYQDAYRYTAVSFTAVGASGVTTTVDDLALWDRNFYDARVGGRDVIAQMQVPGVLNSGAPVKYASGLMIDSYRGQKVVEHSGGIGGYRVQLSRFPDQQFSVILLGNAKEIKHTEMTRKIADIYLANVLAPAPTTPVATAPAARTDLVGAAQIDALLGYYSLAPDFGLTITKEDGHLVMQRLGRDKVKLRAVHEREFVSEAESDLRLVFDVSGKDGLSQRVVLRQDGRDTPATRSSAPTLPGRGWKDFEGEFYSDELRVLYRVTLKDGKLNLVYPLGMLPLTFIGNGTFAAGDQVGNLKYQCNRSGCTGFTVNDSYIRGVQFTKVAIVGSGARQAGSTGVFLPARP